MVCRTDVTVSLDFDTEASPAEVMKFVEDFLVSLKKGQAPENPKLVGSRILTVKTNHQGKGKPPYTKMLEYYG